MKESLESSLRHSSSVLTTRATVILPRFLPAAEKSSMTTLASAGLAGALLLADRAQAATASATGEATMPNNNPRREIDVSRMCAS
jgi:hypothetical protein